MAGRRKVIVSPTQGNKSKRSSNATTNNNSSNSSSSRHDDDNDEEQALVAITSPNVVTPSSRAPFTQANDNHHATTFHPKLIFCQMVALQSFHYLFLTICFQFNSILFGTPLSIDRVFTTNYITIWSGSGWVDNCSVLLTSIFGALLLALLVEKSKKCLDFSVTLFALHLVFCTLYGGFPATWDWWIVHIFALILMVVLGEFLCSRKELSDIPLLIG